MTQLGIIIVGLAILGIVIFLLMRTVAQEVSGHDKQED